MVRIGTVLFGVALVLSAVACGSTTTEEGDVESADNNYTRYDPNRADAGDGGASDEAPGVALDENGMPRQRTINGFSFGGCEYWPVARSASPYPDHIVWGCSPGSSPQAHTCMAASMRRLAVILQDPPPELLQLKERYRISSFFNWNNDYYGAPEGRRGTDNLWLYEGSLIKWISMTDRDGTCRLPEKRDLVTFANRCLRATPDANGRIRC